MAITQAMCTSFKQELLAGVHIFSGASPDTFKIALYTSAADINAATTVYSSSNEVPASGSYPSGGGTLTGTSVTTPVIPGTTVVIDFSDISFTSATITARGALIYNSSKSNKSVAVLDFGADKIVTGGTFTIQFPTPDATNGLLRLA